MSQKQRPTVVPQDAGRSAETALQNFFPCIGPVRFASIAYIVLLVVPPQLKATEGPILISPQPENIAVIEQLLYLSSVFYTDLFHCSILHEKIISVCGHRY
jgi:hypothetical protein